MSEWIEYHELEPFGDDHSRADWRAAMQAQNVRNSLRTKGRSAKLKDFLPKRRKQYMSQEQIWQNLMMHKTMSENGA